MYVLLCRSKLHQEVTRLRILPGLDRGICGRIQGFDLCGGFLLGIFNPLLMAHGIA